MYFLNNGERLFFLAQTPSNVIVAEVTLADNGLGLMPLVYSPPSLLHLYADKTIRVRVRGPGPAFRDLLHLKGFPA